MSQLEAIIVEDDPMVARINERCLASVPGLRLAGVFGDAPSALDHLRRRPVDLVVLDVRLPGLGGEELLRLMRREGLEAAVIVATAANDAGKVGRILRLGVEDYLVKPFTEGRFRSALERWLARRRTLSSPSPLSQGAIDGLLSVPIPGHRPAPQRQRLPKGLQQSTLELIAGRLPAAPAAHLDCGGLSRATGLSKVTLRRYLGHLIQTGAAESVVRYDTGGRPAVLYRLVRPARPEA